MSRYILLAVAALSCGLSNTAFSQEIITGEKFNAFRADAAAYMGRSVVLEDTFKSIVDNFNRVETSNNLTPNRHVKFRLGRSPYPCIGLRTNTVMSGLRKVGPGDLVRVTGNLKTIREKRPRIKSSGKYKSGIKYKERTRIYGPEKKEVIFEVARVEKGWGREDSFQEMVAEGKGLDESNYRLVKPGESQLEKPLDVEKLVARAITFKGTYEGVDVNFSELEKAAGLSLKKAIKFRVNTGKKDIVCYIPFSERTLEEFKAIPAGTRVQVFGRIRMKSTPKGVLVGFVADDIDALGGGEPAPSSEK